MPCFFFSPLSCALFHNDAPWISNVFSLWAVLLKIILFSYGASWRNWLYNPQGVLWDSLLSSITVLTLLDIWRSPITNFLKEFHCFPVRNILQFHKHRISIQTSCRCIVSCILFFWKAAAITKGLFSRYFQEWLAWFQEANLNH